LLLLEIVENATRDAWEELLPKDLLIKFTIGVNCEFSSLDIINVSIMNKLGISVKEKLGIEIIVGSDIALSMMVDIIELE
jgi:hypothetical protein